MENNNPDYDEINSQQNNQIDSDDIDNNSPNNEIIIDDIVNDIDINIVDDINIDNELTFNNIENQNNNINNNSTQMSNNNLEENNHNNLQDISSTENQIFNSSINMINVIQNLLNTNSNQSNDNISQIPLLDNLINNLNSDLRNRTNVTIPSLLNNIINNIDMNLENNSSHNIVENINIQETSTTDNDSDNMNHEEENEEKTEENIEENQIEIPMLESDYMEYIQTGNLNRQIQNTSYNTSHNRDSFIRARNRISQVFGGQIPDTEDTEDTEDNQRHSIGIGTDENNTYDEDFQYALRLQQQEYMLSSRHTSISTPPQIPVIRRIRRINNTLNSQLESRDGRIRINRNTSNNNITNPEQVNSNLSTLSTPIQIPQSTQISRSSLHETNQIFRTFGTNILQDSSMRNFRNIISNIMNTGEGTMEDIPIVLEEKQFDNFKKIKYNNEHRNNDVHIKCTICLGPYENNEMLTILPCNHGFHSSCISIWLNQHSYKCPICRSETGKGKPNFNNNNNENLL